MTKTLTKPGPETAHPVTRTIRSAKSIQQGTRVHPILLTEHAIQLQAHDTNRRQPTGLTNVRSKT